MQQPLISVIVPCYNQSIYMDECLQSVLDQTYQNWECIIVNDGSPDNTEEVALRWVEKDTRFIYLKKENGGLSSARNAGIDKAKGEWIQFLDCDDIILEHKFEVAIIHMNQYDIIICNFNLFNELGEYEPFCDLNKAVFNLENIILKWDNGLNIPIHCAIFKKSSILNFKFIESLKSKEDWIFWISFYEINKKTKFINKSLAKYRINPNSVGLNTFLIMEANKYLYENSSSLIKDLTFKKINIDNKIKNDEIIRLRAIVSKLENNKFFSVYKRFRGLLKI
ncbi:glycosyltransferase family 2 protein [Empedobacter falsenii]|uniref:Hyaluronan synthase n=1 Tax=Empedobacter falsenii TaxID=343874 RepID=A0A376G545_9FLAO|nr:glycosyltransferase family 2 protein [Empedobacter falsenii]STD54077.1 Hyaluronan synthase [Empedobacter falsenii]